jgi:curved DNA-binding protein CbpA
MPIGEAATVLDVDPGADDGAIKRAYREKAKRLHPDVDGGDEAAFKEATEAYERLTGD